MPLITDNVRIDWLKPLISPAILMEQLPIDDDISNLVAKTREEVTRIIHGEDHRLLVVIGPCSIHDPQAAVDYAKRLKVMADALRDSLCIIMRVYFQKPRTRAGWRGLINDPELNDSFSINKGLYIARKLLLDINHLKMPAGTEFLDTIIPQFIGDLIAWGAIGARTTESQIHRELVSGLSAPIGFKNGTTGSIKIAIDAIKVAQQPHHFLGVTKQNISAIVKTKGNNACHIILRGSNKGPNCDVDSIQATTAALKNVCLPPYLMVDCSHGNSNKDYRQQSQVTKDICTQISGGSKMICGVMLESNLVEGRQELRPDEQLIYGQSVTDTCISWDETVHILQNLAKAVQQRRQSSSSVTPAKAGIQ